MEQYVLAWITQYGYFAIFCLLVLGIVGLPVPDETLLTFSGYLVFKGHFGFLPTVASAYAGSIWHHHQLHHWPHRRPLPDPQVWALRAPHQGPARPRARLV